MPRPLYIICSESGAEDARTGVLSIFKIIEKVTAMPLDAELPAGAIPIPTFQVTAVWMRNPDESPEDEYEFQTAFHEPPDDRETIVQRGTFYFGPTGKHLYRMIVVSGSRNFAGPGFFRAESRIRRVGTDEWIRQDYPFFVEFQRSQDSPAESADQATDAR